MTAKNDITGDAIITKTPSESYRDGWERIFGKKEIKEELPTVKDVPKEDKDLSN